MVQNGSNKVIECRTWMRVVINSYGLFYISFKWCKTLLITLKLGFIKLCRYTSDFLYPVCSDTNTSFPVWNFIFQSICYRKSLIHVFTQCANMHIYIWFMNFISSIHPLVLHTDSYTVVALLNDSGCFWHHKTICIVCLLSKYLTILEILLAFR